MRNVALDEDQSPLLSWTKRTCRWMGLVSRTQVPVNLWHDSRLHRRHRPCWPLPRNTCPAPANGSETTTAEPARLGEFAGNEKKKECGLHVIEHQGGSGIELIASPGKVNLLASDVGAWPTAIAIRSAFRHKAIADVRAS